LSAGACTVGSIGGEPEDVGQVGSAIKADKGGKNKGGPNATTCVASPNPATVGGLVEISVNGAPANTSLRIDVVDDSGLTAIAIQTDASGTALGFFPATSEGAATAHVIEELKKNEKLRASCSFQVSGPCEPSTCAELGAECGTVSDGCGGLIECGGCTAPDVCGGGGPNLCGPESCTPTSCQDAGATCGTIDDGCGGTLDCGACGGIDSCGGGGVPNQCGCTPTTCADVGATCGNIDDGCGSTLDCGSCNGGESCGGGGVPNECGSGAWPSLWAQYEAEVLLEVNARRAEGATCGSTSYGSAPPLTMNAEMRTAARLHSEDMGAQDYFSHTSLDGRSFLDRMLQAGWSGSCPCGENIAAGYSSPTSVVNGWMNSPGHCANIMNPSYSVTGIGYAYDNSGSYGAYWTQNFGAN
jgi:uncharacterized protein YkwD